MPVQCWHLSGPQGPLFDAKRLIIALLRKKMREKAGVILGAGCASGFYLVIGYEKPQQQ